MKKILTTLILLFSMQAQAGLITMNVSDSIVSTGDKLTVDIIGNNIAPSDAFSFDLLFDSSLFKLDTTNLMSDLFTSNPFAIFFEVAEVGNKINVSFLDFLPIPSSDNFLLVSFELEAIALGESDLVFDNVNFYEPASFDPQEIDSDTTAKVSVVEVSEPTMWGLMLMSLVLVGVRRTKFQS